MQPQGIPTAADRTWRGDNRRHGTRELRWPASAALLLSLVAHAALVLFTPEIRLMQPVAYQQAESVMRIRPRVAPPDLPAPGLPTHADALAPQDPEQMLQAPLAAEQELARFLSGFEAPSVDPLAALEGSTEPDLPDPHGGPTHEPPPILALDPSILPPDAASIDLIPERPVPPPESALSINSESGLDSTLTQFSVAAGSGLDRPVLPPDLPDLAPGIPSLPTATLPQAPDIALATELPGLPEAEGNAPEPIDAFVDIELRSFQGNDPFIYFEVQILNPPDRPLPPLPRTVWYVVDSSRSMGEATVLMAAEGIYQSLQILQPGTLWNLVQFKANPQFFHTQPVSAIDSERRRDAILFLDGIHASGQTDVFRSLQTVVAAIDPEASRPVQVFLVSDGRPTSGVRDSRSIIDQISRINRAGTSVFTLGTGRNANRELISYLAYWNRGASSVHVPVQQIPQALVQMTQAYRRPVLHRPRYRIIGADPGAVLPSLLPDLYEGIPLVLYGRVPKDQPSFAMHLLGQGRSGPRDLLVPIDPVQAKPGDSGIRQAWAESFLRELRGRQARGDNAETIEVLIRQTADRYRLPIPE